MNINDYKDVNGNVDVSETLVSDIIGGINGNESAIGGLTKGDVGLNNVLNERQAFTVYTSANNINETINLPNKNGCYLLVSAWTSTGSGMWIIAVRGVDIHISEVKGDTAVAISSSGLQLIVNKTTYRFISLIDIY